MFFFLGKVSSKYFKFIQILSIGNITLIKLITKFLFYNFMNNFRIIQNLFQFLLDKILNSYYFVNLKQNSLLS